MLIFYRTGDYQKLKILLETCDMFNVSYDNEEFVNKKIEQDPESIIIFDENDLLIGCVFIVYDPWSSYIYRLAVHPDHRGKGLASILMDKAENVLKEKGTNPITIFVEEENEDVLEFYKKRGYKQDGKIFMLEKRL